MSKAMPAKTLVWKGAAFIAGLGLSMLSGPGMPRRRAAAIPCMASMTLSSAR